MTDVTLNPTVDSDCHHSHAIWATVWGAAVGTTITSGTSPNRAGHYTLATQNINRAVLVFDTSAITPGFLSAKLRLYVSSIGQHNTTLVLQATTITNDPMLVADYAKANFSGDYGSEALINGTEPLWVDIDISDISIINSGGTTRIGLRDLGDVNNLGPQGNNHVDFHSSEGANPPQLVLTYPTDTATLKDAALTLFAHRTVQNASLFDNPNASPISYIRFYDSNGDYIQVPVMRSYDSTANPIYDDTGGSEADPEFTSVTQYYHDLDLVTEIPRFTKTYDVDAFTWGYSTDPFTVADYKLFNAGGVVLAEAADSTITGFSIVQGTRYTVRFKIRFFNDMVEQSIGENTRVVITTEGLKTITRRMLLSGSQHEYARAPVFIGVGVEGAYYISNGSDGRWYYDDSSASYTNVATDIFPPASAAEDYFMFCREETTDDDLEGIEFVLNGVGDPLPGMVLVWQYYNTSSVWTNLSSVSDTTEQFQSSGIVRWEAPMDIATDAEVKAGTVGRYYRCKLIGDGFDVGDTPTVAAATNITPLAFRTAESETGLQLPMNRKMADLVITPATGHAAKVSAEFGPGGIVERTRPDDGTLLSNSYEVVREVGLFTAVGKTDQETIDLGEFTGAVVSKIINIPTATNPEPIKLYSAVDANGVVYDVADRIITFDEVGINYETTVPLPDGTYDLVYLGRDITPSITPQNILAVDGNVQNLRGPNSVWIYASERNPVDSDTGADTFMTPRAIATSAILLHDGGEGALSPNFSKGPDDRGMVTSAADWGLASLSSTGLKPGSLGKAAGLLGTGQTDPGIMPKFLLPGDTLEFKFTPGYPMVMARFNISNMDRLESPVFTVSASGFVKYPEEAKFYYHVMVWSEGDPAAKEAHHRETGWKTMGTSTPIVGKSGIPTNVTIQLPMKYRDVENYVSSPYVNESGDIYVMVVSSDKTDGDKSWKQDGSLGWIGDPLFSTDKDETVTDTWSKKARQKFGDMGVAYIGMISSPVGDASVGRFSFRRGVDWTYYLGDTEAYWRIDGSNGGDPENYAVVTRTGVPYLPVLPTARIGQATEWYKFGALPSDDPPNNIKLYLQHRPIDSGGIYIWLEGEETRIDNFNKGITVNNVGWDDDAIWNDIDPAFSEDHMQADNGGEGAGYVDVSFASKDWSNTEFRDVAVRYLYYNAPKLNMTYLHGGGTMFARAHFSDVSHNTKMNPVYGDRIRFYFEVQFEEKRT